MGFDDGKLVSVALMRRNATYEATENCRTTGERGKLSPEIRSSKLKALESDDAARLINN